MEQQGNRFSIREYQHVVLAKWSAVSADPKTTCKQLHPAKNSNNPNHVAIAVALILFVLVLTGGCRDASSTDSLPDKSVSTPSSVAQASEQPAVAPSATALHPTPRTTETPTLTATVPPTETRTPTETPTSAPTRAPAVITFPEGPSSLGDTLERSADGMVMVYVPGGTFEMGSMPDTEYFGPHTVTLDGFWIDRTEVTNAQFAAFLNDQGNQVGGGATWLEIEQVENAQIEFIDGVFQPESGKANHPVVEVNWSGVDAYCRWVGGRLPTEAEWEYAARGPDAHVYPWGNDPPNCDQAQFGGCGDHSVPVGSFSGKGASWVGAEDMAGNVWEWTADWYAVYPSGPQFNPTGPETGERKVFRGGSFLSAPDTLHGAYRLTQDLSSRQPVLGFRCAAGLPKSAEEEGAIAITSELGIENRMRPSDGMRMVKVPGGMFQMGSTQAEIEDAIALCGQHYSICNSWYYMREHPQHTVSLDDFWLDQTEVSNAQYRRCVEEGGCSEPPSCTDGEPDSQDEERSAHPVVCVNWYDAHAYCEWAGARLPTEAEWEYAFRGEEGYLFPWGDGFDGGNLNYCDANCKASHMDARYDDGYSKEAPVGSFPQGISWSGAFNLGGNVSEWVADWLGDYDLEPQDNPSGPESGAEKMLKGCSWFFHPAYCRGATRASIAQAVRFDFVGFRCATSIEP